MAIPVSRLLPVRKRPEGVLARRSGDSVFRWSACWPGCCSEPPTGCPAAVRSGAATRRGWWIWSAVSSPRSTGSTPSGIAWSHHRLDARPIRGRSTRGDAAAIGRAGRRRRPGPDARAGARRDAHRRAARRERPLPARRLAGRPRRAPAGHPGRAERTVDSRRRGDPDAGPAHHRHLGAAMRRQHPAAQRPNLQPALHDHRDRRRRHDAGGAGRRAARDALQAVRRAVRAGLHRATAARCTGRGYTGPVRMHYAEPAGPISY